MTKLLLTLALIGIVSIGYSQTDTTSKGLEVKKLLLKETKKGGKYDFFTPIKGHEQDGIQVKPGVYDTKLGLALIKWGKATYELGVASLEDAYLIFSEFKVREAYKLEKFYIKMGYNRELEK